MQLPFFKLIVPIAKDVFHWRFSLSRFSNEYHVVYVKVKLQFAQLHFYIQ